ncbi:MAG: hypothetical protein U0263_28235 [Polyangiaceae bacterium]
MSAEKPAVRPAALRRPDAAQAHRSAIGCAALLPIAFGGALTRPALETAAVFCLLFGFRWPARRRRLEPGQQERLLGGTVFSAFAFNWAVSSGPLDPLAGRAAVCAGAARDRSGVPRPVPAADLRIRLPLSSSSAFLLDIDVLFAAKLLKGYLHVPGLGLPIALLTLGLGAIALYIALAMLVNPVVGRAVFPVPGPLFTLQSLAPVASREAQSSAEFENEPQRIVASSA